MNKWVLYGIITALTIAFVTFMWIAFPTQIGLHIVFTSIFGLANLGALYLTWAIDE